MARGPSSFAVRITFPRFMTQLLTCSLLFSCPRSLSLNASKLPIVCEETVPALDGVCTQKPRRLAAPRFRSQFSFAHWVRLDSHCPGTTSPSSSSSLSILAPCPALHGAAGALHSQTPSNPSLPHPPTRPFRRSPTRRSPTRRSPTRHFRRPPEYVVLVR